MLKLRYILIFIFILTNNFVKAQLPDAPTVDTASVEPINVKGDVYIAWEPMDETKIKGYIIYRNTGTDISPIWLNIDTIYGGANSFYKDINSNADGEPESYRLRSFDFADTKSLFSDIMTTMYTFPYIEENNCIPQIRVHWTPYIGLVNGILEYNIYCSVNDGPYTMIGTVSGSENEYIHTGLNDTTSYSYYVVAKSFDGKTSTSNSVRTSTDFPDIPKYINADYATVENSYIKLSYTLDITSEVKNYRIMRSNNISGPFYGIKSVYNYTSPILQYNDNAVNVKYIYYYKLESIDNCGNTLMTSNVSKNIVIDVQSDDDFAPVITWDRYIDWLGEDIEYKVFRVVDGIVEQVYTTSSGINFYKDEISDEDISKISSKLCYMVEAIEGDNNPYGVKGYSKSAIKCLEQASYLVMPNTFSPNNNGINDIFKPVSLFVSKENYLFQIYNRWGEKIFSTSDPKEGWNGRSKKGKVYPEGFYYYILEYKDFYGESFDMSGKLTLFF